MNQHIAPDDMPDEAPNAATQTVCVDQLRAALDSERAQVDRLRAYIQKTEDAYDLLHAEQEQLRSRLDRTTKAWEDLISVASFFV